MRAVPRLTRAAGSGGWSSGRGFLDQARQRQAHRVVNIRGAEAGAAKLQLGDKAPEEDAALLRRQTVGGRPEGPKLRIRQSDHAAMVLPGTVTCFYVCSLARSPDV